MEEERERLWKMRECEKPLMRDREWRNIITKSKGKGSWRKSQFSQLLKSRAVRFTVGVCEDT